MLVMDGATAPQLADLIEEAVTRLREGLAILDTIDRAELFCELPSGSDAAERHQSGVSLLAILRRELTALWVDLDSSHQAHDLIRRLGPAE